MQTLPSQLDIPPGKVSGFEIAMPLATSFGLPPDMATAFAFALGLELPICSPTGLTIVFDLEIALGSASARSSELSSALEKTEAGRVHTPS